MELVPIRRLVDAIQIPSRVGHTPTTYLAALAPVIEFLTEHAISYLLDSDDFDYVEIHEGTTQFVPAPLDWIVFDPSSENNDVILFTDEEISERYRRHVDVKEATKLFNRAADIIAEGMEDANHRANPFREEALQIVANLEAEELLTDDAPLEPPVVDDEVVDEYRDLDTAVRAFPIGDPFDGPILAWMLLRDHGESVEIITGIENTHTANVGIVTAAANDVERRLYS